MELGLRFRIIVVVRVNRIVKVLEERERREQQKQKIRSVPDQLILEFDSGRATAGKG